MTFQTMPYLFEVEML